MVSVNMIPPVKIITQPTNKTKYIGDTITLNVKAENVASYQWFYSKDGTTWYKSGATGNTTNTLSFVLSSSNAGRYYKCKMLDRAGVACFTNTVTVKADLSVKITTQPTTVTAVIGETVSFKVATKNAESYQWFFSTDGKTWYKSGLTGATSNTLTFKLSESNKGRYYKCKVIGVTGDSVLSNTVTVNVDPSMKILSQPVNASGKIGDTVKFKVTAANVASYQWFYSKDGKTWYKSGSTGYNTDTLTIKITSTTEGRFYKCKLTDSDGKTLLTDVVQ